MQADWYIKNAGSESGPFSLDELIQKAQSGQLSPDTLVRKGNKEWNRVVNFSFLAQVMPLYSEHLNEKAQTGGTSQETQLLPGKSPPENRVPTMLVHPLLFRQESPARNVLWAIYVLAAVVITLGLFSCFGGIGDFGKDNPRDKARELPKQAKNGFVPPQQNVEKRRDRENENNQQEKEKRDRVQDNTRQRLIQESKRIEQALITKADIGPYDRGLGVSFVGGSTGIEQIRNTEDRIADLRRQAFQLADNGEMNRARNIMEEIHKLINGLHNRQVEWDVKARKLGVKIPDGPSEYDEMGSKHFQERIELERNYQKRLQQ